MEEIVATANLDERFPGRIVVQSGFRWKEHIKHVPGARWSSTEKIWHVPLSWPSCIALRAEFGPGLQISEDLAAWTKPTSVRKAAMSELHQNPLDEQLAWRVGHEFYGLEGGDTDDLAGFSDLFPYQFSGAVAIAVEQSYLVFDETGTGKSRTALAGLRLADIKGPTLIVAPKSMLHTWRIEIAGFFPDADVRICAGTPTKIRRALEPGADFYVVSYDTIRNYSRLAPWPTVTLSEKEKLNKEFQELEFGAVVADEIHRVRNPSSKRTRALWLAAGDAPIRIGLTGTPMQDTPEDLWALLHFIAPATYTTKSPFVDRWLEVTWNHWGGRDVSGLSLTHGDEFLRNFDTVSRRVTKEAALPFLPSKLFEMRWVTLPPKLRRVYDSMEEELVAELGEGLLIADSVLERAGRLVQLSNASGELDEDGGFHMTLPSPKVDAFMEDVLDGDFEGQQVVVFSDSRQLIELLSAEMSRKKIEHTKITGSVTGDARQDAMEKFQAGEVPFILVTRAGGEGITLTAASVMVRLVRAWSFIVHTQAEDRVHRIGSEIHDSITIIDYVTEDTVEEGQFVRLNAKGVRAQEVLRDSELRDLLKTRIENKKKEST